MNYHKILETFGGFIDNMSCWSLHGYRISIYIFEHTDICTNVYIYIYIYIYDIYIYIYDEYYNIIIYSKYIVNKYIVKIKVVFINAIN